ncbi:MAG: TetR family transcriptional regulator [Flavobacteriales bacterium]|nr:TetR family transcriptional regulator [Flavobacteriales bacterium]
MATEISTEERILDAARSVFLRKGMVGTRMQEVADEAASTRPCSTTTSETSSSSSSRCSACAGNGPCRACGWNSRRSVRCSTTSVRS